MSLEVPRIRALRDRLWDRLRDLSGMVLNGSMERRIANNLNLSLRLEHGETLMAVLTVIAVSSTAACDSSGVSHVLQALGNDVDVARNSLRITVGGFNTGEEIDYAAHYLRRKIDDCCAGPPRSLSYLVPANS